MWGQTQVTSFIPNAQALTILIKEIAAPYSYFNDSLSSGAELVGSERKVGVSEKIKTLQSIKEGGRIELQKTCQS